MRERGRRGAAGWVGRLAVVLLATLPLVACGRSEDDGLRIRFEDKAEPGVFQRTGNAVRDAAGGAGGLWAAVPDLPRPERAEIVNLDTGERATVALFRSADGAMRLSNEAADALGIAAIATPVRITAVRSVPEIEHWTRHNHR